MQNAPTPASPIKAFIVELHESASDEAMAQHRAALDALFHPDRVTNLTAEQLEAVRKIAP